MLLLLLSATALASPGPGAWSPIRPGSHPVPGAFDPLPQPKAKPLSPLPPKSAPPKPEPKSAEKAAAARLVGATLLVVQPRMEPADWKSADSLVLKLEKVTHELRAHHSWKPNSIFLLPEYIGSWLLGMDEWPLFYSSPSLTLSMALMALHRPVDLFVAWRGTRSSDWFTEALFRMKAMRMAQAYQDVFATLAIRTRAAIIGGSIVLPSPSVVEGKIKIDLAGPLQNVSFMFTPDGRLVPSVVRKIHLTREELPFLKPGKLEELPVFDTPFGKVAAPSSAPPSGSTASLASGPLKSLPRARPRRPLAPGRMVGAKESRPKARLTKSYRFMSEKACPERIFGNFAPRELTSPDS